MTQQKSLPSGIYFANSLGRLRSHAVFAPLMPFMSHPRYAPYPPANFVAGEPIYLGEIAPRGKRLIIEHFTISYFVPL